MKNKQIITIGIDGNEANISEKSGVHKYANELLHALYRIINGKSKKFMVIVYLKSPPAQDMPQQNDNWKYKVIPGEKLWVLCKLTPHLLFSKDIDVFFTPSHYAPLLSNRPIVCTIHDLGYLVFTEQFKKYDYWQLRLWSARSIFISRKIIAVSAATKNDIVRRYSIKREKIAVIHHGIDSRYFNTKIDKNIVRHLCKKYKINKNYILFLSTLKPSKNIEGLLEAFARIRENNDVHLVIAGGKGWMYESIFNKIVTLGLERT
jgi:glycosyltransferase involved in cell wall biosynthesis